MSNLMSCSKEHGEWLAPTDAITFLDPVPSGVEWEYGCLHDGYSLTAIVAPELVGANEGCARNGAGRAA